MANPDTLLGLSSTIHPLLNDVYPASSSPTLSNVVVVIGSAQVSIQGTDVVLTGTISQLGLIELEYEFVVGGVSSNKARIRVYDNEPMERRRDQDRTLLCGPSPDACSELVCAGDFEFVRPIINNIQLPDLIWEYALGEPNTPFVGNGFNDVVAGESGGSPDFIYQVANGWRHSLNGFSGINNWHYNNCQSGTLVSLFPTVLGNSDTSSSIYGGIATGITTPLGETVSTIKSGQIGLPLSVPVNTLDQLVLSFDAYRETRSRASVCHTYPPQFPNTCLNTVQEVLLNPVEIVIPS